MSRTKLATPKRVYARRNDFSARLLCLAPVMHQRLFCGSQRQIVSYDNEFTVKWRGVLPNNATLQGLHRRVLQLHMCIIYFFGGISKCAGRGWWNGISLWRALTRAPFDIVPPEILIRASFILTLAGILVCVMEATYAIFIWPRKTRFIWFAGVLGMHVGIGLLMGMYLFASVMIVLNLAAFGPGFAFNRSVVSKIGHPNTDAQATLPAKHLSA